MIICNIITSKFYKITEVKLKLYEMYEIHGEIRR